MRVNGLDKFNGPNIVGSVNYYLSQQDVKEHNPFGTFIVYIEEGSIEKLYKALGLPKFEDDDLKAICEHTTQLCTELATKLKTKLAGSGYKNLIVENPMSQKNSLSDGAEFPYEEYNYVEVIFDLWKKKTLVVDVVLPPAR